MIFFLRLIQILLSLSIKRRLLSSESFSEPNSLPDLIKMLRLNWQKIKTLPFYFIGYLTKYSCLPLEIKMLNFKSWFIKQVNIVFIRPEFELQSREFLFCIGLVPLPSDHRINCLHFLSLHFFLHFSVFRSSFHFESRLRKNLENSIIYC